MNATKKDQVNYGNWVYLKLIYIPAALSIIFLGLSYFSLYFLIGTAGFLAPCIYIIYAYRQFSPGGGDLQTKIRGLVLENLSWKGKGKLLDIGCGNGALAIEVARKYPTAQVTGIDFWGPKWEYSQQACEKNSELAGVAGRTHFQKASAASLPFKDESFEAAVSNLVFHEVADARDKKAVIKEALRVVQKGGFFAFQDLFLQKSLYGDPRELVTLIKSWGVQEVCFINTSDREFIPAAMKSPLIIGRIGIIYGKK
jgi:ubiquinone/menaquinone biosynthesis C-methylase UbiE